MKRHFKKTIFGLAVGLSITSLGTPAFASTYQAKPQDTLWKIASANKIPLPSILKANPNINPLNLQPGELVNLPDLRYTVKDGDTFWIIAKKLQLPLDQLMAANPKVDPNNLYPGIVLTLPAASIGKTVSVSSTSASPNSILVARQAIAFKKKISVKATAYSSDPSENGWGPVDYYGNLLKLGTIAVDPSIIPMGSKVLITGYNDIDKDLPSDGLIAYATDQGSTIKGNRIDIFLPGSVQKVSNFGIQDVNVYILEP
ncbi:LysM peptidoglycan-binding domain-containing protein [Paenibacillus chondroitinus]|uniref:LysM peptidoglycan-binding domain-containing protein n=1 Tax=Paenibacillus chondroitinus TaxID=59842 RepID=A0ABU6DCM5_9BACL|nr:MULTISPECIES: LysM peptidoglycan-binding domain-containing protein [Paenibacillus]MCY9659862.1 LysM peptidoglycan-binding domain-containing protein [Paenibacillus anseongense]MEB4795520.1 LysM peptidoglycan-binding domain-containing protein [Paenibacillus chondroitinus]